MAKYMTGKTAFYVIESQNNAGAFEIFAAHDRR